MTFSVVKNLVVSAVLAFSMYPMGVVGVLEWQDGWNEAFLWDDCWPKESPSTTDNYCLGRRPVATNLDFKNAKVGQSQLHKGGVLTYEKIGKVGNDDIDLIVSVVPGTEYKSKKGKKKNGISGEFGQINLYTVMNNHESGKGSFRFCLHDHESGEKKKAESFRFTIYDVDERGGNPNGIKERIVFDATQAEDYFVWPSLNESDLRGWCTSGAPTPCKPGDDMIFHSSSYGNINDNPRAIETLTSTQKKRSVVFYFKDTDCFDLGYEHYCEIEEEKPGSKCTWYGGSNMMFSGDALSIVNDGVCVSTQEQEEISSPPPTPSPTESSCLGKTKMDTDLDFFNANLTENELHLQGRMKFEDIGIVRDRPVDLIVSVVPGTTYESERADERNGISGKFGNINLFTKLGNLESGQGHFRFCFHDHETQDLTKVDSFVWSVYDVDERGAGHDGIKEKMIMDLSQVTNYMLYPNTQNTEIKVSCEDAGESPPCQARTVFHSSTKGNGGDNPSDPNNMTEEQMKRSIVFAFEDTDCWDITYEHFCKFEEEQGGECKWYGGGNFLFAGSAKEMIEEGECLTSAPTQQPDPTAFPTLEPTIEPTGSPTRTPTVSPTDEPTTTPTDSPTGGPTRTPTGKPTTPPTDSPTDGPTGTPTAKPIDFPTGGPTGTPTAGPTSPPTDLPTDGPTNLPTATPTEVPTTEAPKPTDAPTPKWNRNGEEPESDDYFLPPDCPSDVKVVRTVGVTEFPPTDLVPTVEIVSKNVDDNTVTVALNQAFGRSKGSISSIYYRWEPSYLSEKCIQETDVAKGEKYAEITVQCGSLKPFAKALICLAEPLEKGFLQPEDNATIPKCCQDGEREDTPVVCYTIEIQCTPGCANEDSQQAVRRKLRGAN